MVFQPQNSNANKGDVFQHVSMLGGLIISAVCTLSYSTSMTLCSYLFILNINYYLLTAMDFGFVCGQQTIAHGRLFVWHSSEESPQ